VTKNKPIALVKYENFLFIQRFKRDREHSVYGQTNLIPDEVWFRMYTVCAMCAFRISFIHSTIKSERKL